MMIQGSSGNIRPKFQQSNAENLEINYYEEIKKNYSNEEKEQLFQESIDSLNKMANTIYESLDKVYFNIALKEINNIEILSNKHRFYADVPNMEKTSIIVEEAHKMAHINPKNWLNEVQRLNNENIKQQSSDIEIQYFILNDGIICGIPNEAMCEIHLEMKNKVEQPYFFFNGYTNGTSSYLPTEYEYDKGGYEVLWSNLIYYIYHGRVMPLNKDTADKMIGEVVHFLNEYKF